MLKAIIVDDELKSRESLKKMLIAFCQGVEVAATCQSVAEALQAIDSYKPDVVFLDVQMQGETGFDLLEKMKSFSFEIIFTTAHSEYAIRAIKYAAIDYLLKPIDIDELQAAIERVNARKGTNLAERMQLFLQNMRSPSFDNLRLSLPVAEGLTFVTIDEILYMKAAGSYTEIFMKNGRMHLVSRNLKEYDDLLSEKHFFRIHHSILVNIRCIDSYVRGEGGYVIMSDGVSLEVSRRKKDAFLEKIGHKK